MPFARVNTIVLHYEVSGARGQPALVFSNSLGTDFRIWDGVVERLRERFLIVRYDKRGHGLSEETPAPYALTDHVDDLAALLDHLGIGQAAIVGLSVGGMIAQGLAARRPDLVNALVLSNTAHKIGTEARWNERIETVRRDGIRSISDGVMKLWFTEQFRDPGNADFVGYKAMLERSPVEGYVGTCAALRDADLTESTRALQIPVLCIAGDQDGSTPRDLVRSMADLIRGAEFHVIENAGHIPNVERPEAVAALIGTFLMQARNA
ncbi:MAG: 3-oxoadipate enol-lactonase [Rhizobiaceae bacterium]|nr:3-oxoadipate enol-lactonase [Rhizobiaceae bacterium]